MFLRETPTETVIDLYDLIAPPVRSTTAKTCDISVDLLKANPSIKIQTGIGKPAFEVPATGDGVMAVGNWLNIPSKFLGRLTPDIQETLMNSLLGRSDKVALIETKTDETGLVDIVDTNSRRIDPREVVEIANRVIGPDATVVEWRKDNTGYGFDVVVPDSFDRAIGGDRAVGDITRGGLRFGQDTKHNLAPYVQRYLYRLVCTNGMEVSTQVNQSSRGATIEELLDSLESNAWDAFSRVDNDIRSFYDLRSQRVLNPEQTLIRIAGEQGVSDRILANLLRELPEYTDDHNEATVFDLVNLVTNYANVGSMTNRFSSRRGLEAIGGDLINDHASRCPNCLSRLSA